jgi:hypothetical protein
MMGALFEPRFGVGAASTALGWSTVLLGLGIFAGFMALGGSVTAGDVFIARARVAGGVFFGGVDAGFGPLDRAAVVSSELVGLSRTRRPFRPRRSTARSGTDRRPGRPAADRSRSSRPPLEGGKYQLKEAFASDDQSAAVPQRRPNQERGPP